MDGFMKRHANHLALRKGLIHDGKRRSADNVQQVKEYFARVRVVRRDGGYAPSHIWNMDESGKCKFVRWPCVPRQVTQCLTSTATCVAHSFAGFTLQGKAAPYMVAPKGAKRVQVNRSCSRENTTLLVAINASGGYRMPMLIFKAVKRVSAAWAKDVPDTWLVSRTESSVIDTALFLDWVKQFCRGLAPGQHLLFLDGHVSHISVEAVEYAEAHRVTIFQLPSHSSHNLQPLDLCAFGVMKKKYGTLLDEFHKTFQTYPTKCDMGKLIHDSFVHAMTPGTITASFRASGIHPSDPSVAVARVRGDVTRKRKHPGSPPPPPPPVLDLRGVPPEQRAIALRDVTNTAQALGARERRTLERQGHSVAAVRVATMAVENVLAPPPRTTQDRARAGIPLGGIVTAKALREMEQEREMVMAGRGAGRGRGRGRGSNACSGHGPAVPA